MAKPPENKILDFQAQRPSKEIFSWTMMGLGCCIEMYQKWWVWNNLPTFTFSNMAILQVSVYIYIYTYICFFVPGCIWGMYCVSSCYFHCFQKKLGGYTTSSMKFGLIYSSPVFLQVHFFGGDLPSVWIQALGSSKQNENFVFVLVTKGTNLHTFRGARHAFYTPWN